MSVGPRLLAGLTLSCRFRPVEPREGGEDRLGVSRMSGRYMGLRQAVRSRWSGADPGSTWRSRCGLPDFLACRP